MKQKTEFSLPFLGGSSLLTIFTVLCLTMLALLSLATVRAEQRLAESSAQAAVSWYQADQQAQTVFARLRNGETVPEVQEKDGEYRFSCPISHNQQLEAVLRKDSSGWTVLRWQAVALPQTGDENTNLWNGGIP